MTKMTLIAAAVAASTFLVGCGLTDSLANAPEPLNKAQLVEDISFLASDEMKGRENFTAELDEAANFIATRFQEIGLQPLSGLSSFKQQFDLYNVKPGSVSLTVGQQEIDQANTFAISNRADLNWNESSEVTVTYVAEGDDLRSKILESNGIGGNHLILAHPKHSEMFARFKTYFSRGSTKAKLVDQGSLVVAISNISDTSKFNLSAQNTIKKQRLTNVVGVLPGKSKANEQVLFSAHYDHLGTDGEKIYNGADDDASGTSAVINLAQHYAEQDVNERSLVFVAFTAEELGLLGSENFSKLLNPNDVTAMVNIEMIGKPSKFGPGKMWMTGADKSNLRELLNASLAEDEHIQPNPYPKYNLFYRSDNATLAKLGVPAHSFSTSQMDQDKHYHQHTDDLASLNLDSMYQSVLLLARASLPLVKGDVTPSRVAPLPKRPEGKIF